MSDDTWTEVDRNLDAIGAVPFSFMHRMPTEEYPVEFFVRLSGGGDE